MSFNYLILVVETDMVSVRCDAMQIESMAMEDLCSLCFFVYSLVWLCSSVCRLGRVLRHIWCSSARFSFTYISATLFLSRRPPRSRLSLARCLPTPDDETTKHPHPRACFGAHLATYSIPLTVHSFSNKNPRSPPELWHRTPFCPTSLDTR